MTRDEIKQKVRAIVEATLMDAELPYRIGVTLENTLTAQLAGMLPDANPDSYMNGTLRILAGELNGKIESVFEVLDADGIAPAQKLDMISKRLGR